MGCRNALWGCGWAWAAVLPFATAAADEAAREPPARVLPQVVVTGSRILGAEAEGPLPVKVIDSEAIRKSGHATLQGLIADLTQALPTLNSPNASFVPLGGAAAFDLRGLGPGATLVLLNGRRVSSFGDFGENGASFVDVNQIPVALIERIEILKDGASAIYGSDAVAGVVNVILADDLPGAQLSAYAARTGEADGERLALDVATTFRPGEARITTGLSWYRQDEIRALDRDFAEDSLQLDRGGPSVALNDYRFLFGSPPTAVAPGFAPDPECPVVSEVNGFCLLDISPYFWITPEIKRTSAYVRAVQPAGDLELFTEVTYSRLDSDTEAEPTWANADSITAVNGASPLPLVFADHPDNPFGEDVFIVHSAADLGPRKIDDETESWRVVAGVNGLLGSWEWELAGYYGLFENRYKYNNDIDSAAYQLAVWGRGGPNGDQYYNPFGLDPDNAPEMLEFIRDTAWWEQTSEEAGGEVTVRGDVLQLPHGLLAVAAGASFRHQRFDNESSANGANGNSGLVATVPFDARRDVSAAYAELLVPVASALELQLAGRFERYSDYGNAFVPKVAAAWRPARSVLLRASYSESFKAPSQTQVSSPAVFFTGFIPDSARCESVGIPLQDCPSIPIPASTGGNPDLDEETGESWYAGLLWTPEGLLEGLSVGVDLWRFEYTDRIVFLNGAQVLELYGDNPSFVDRDPPPPGSPPGDIGCSQPAFTYSSTNGVRVIETDLYSTVTGCSPVCVGVMIN